ncbi:hypothetical protein CPC08DRAFT_824337 [Agrocybe pediades]|nr:hypothetical protein CPC08DRAFT_824337 [Agrocybe pediades]
MSSCSTNVVSPVGHTQQRSSMVVLSGSRRVYSRLVACAMCQAIEEWVIMSKPDNDKHVRLASRRHDLGSRLGEHGSWPTAISSLVDVVGGLEAVLCEPLVLVHDMEGVLLVVQTRRIYEAFMENPVPDLPDQVLAASFLAEHVFPSHFCTQDALGFHSAPSLQLVDILPAFDATPHVATFCPVLGYKFRHPASAAPSTYVFNLEQVAQASSSCQAPFAAYFLGGSAAGLLDLGDLASHSSYLTDSGAFAASSFLILSQLPFQLVLFMLLPHLVTISVRS